MVAATEIDNGCLVNTASRYSP